MGYTSEKVSGKANELTGKAKQAVGDATDNRKNIVISLYLGCTEIVLGACLLWDRPITHALGR